MSKVQILIDSSSAISPTLAKKFNMHFISEEMIDPKTRKTYQDNLSDELFEILYINNANKNYFKTQQINLKILQKCWKKLLKTNDRVIYFPLTYNLSAQADNALHFAKKHFQNRVWVIRTNLLEYSLKSFLIQEHKNIVQNNLSLEEIYKLQDEYTKHFNAGIIIDNSDILYHSGRIKGIGHQTLKTFNMKAILSYRLNESLKLMKVTRTFKKAHGILINYLEKNSDLFVDGKWKSNTKLAILHTCQKNSPILENFINLVNEYVSKHQETKLKIEIHRLSNTLVAHIGCNNLGLLTCT